MDPHVRSRASRRASARRDLVGVCVAVAATFAVSRHLDLFEYFAEWSRTHETLLDLDEIVMSSFVGVLALAIFTWRRYRETAEVERILAWRTERYRSLFEYNPVAVFSIGPNGLFTSANPAALALCGYSEEELLRQKFLGVVTSEERASTARGFSQVMNRLTRRFEMTLIHRDGHRVALSVTTLPIVIDNEVVGVFGLAQDIGDRVRTLRDLQSARREAEQASELKSLFVANVSHEIRTPLTSVLASTEMLGETNLDTYQQQLLGKTEHSGRRLLRLVDDLLDFSELEARRTSIISKAFDPRVLAERVGAWAEASANEKGLVYTCEVDAPRGACLIGDIDMVTRVLTSLIDNAIKFADSGSIALRIESSGLTQPQTAGSPAWVRFVVADSGIGLSEEQQAHVFDSFSQADGSISRPYEGAGLGLAICRQLISLMGGSIWVEGTLGVGSTFTVHLPQRPALTTDPPADTQTAATVIGGLRQSELLHTTPRSLAFRGVETPHVQDQATHAHSIPSHQQLSTD
jgi:PAS domain S-box-containing protein